MGTLVPGPGIVSSLENFRLLATVPEKTRAPVSEKLVLKPQGPTVLSGNFSGQKTVVQPTDVGTNCSEFETARRKKMLRDAAVKITSGT